jgi:hypothetical protein
MKKGGENRRENGIFKKGRFLEKTGKKGASFS